MTPVWQSSGAEDGGDSKDDFENGGLACLKHHP